MSNQEHPDILLAGVEGWNKWRDEHPEARPNLVGANLNRVDLRGANLQGVNLSEAALHRADLSGANLRLAAPNADLPAIMQAGRWKTAAMPARYAEHLRAARGAVAQYHSGRQASRQRPL